MTQIWDQYSGNGSGDTAVINAAKYGTRIPPKHDCQFFFFNFVSIILREWPKIHFGSQDLISRIPKDFRKF